MSDKNFVTFLTFFDGLLMQGIGLWALIPLVDEPWLVPGLNNYVMATMGFAFGTGFMVYANKRMKIV